MKKERLVRCSFCDAKIPEIAQYCPNCRHIINYAFERIAVISDPGYRSVKGVEEYAEKAPYTGKTFCTNLYCRKEVERGARFCTHCGQRLADFQSDDIKNIRKIERKKIRKKKSSNRKEISCIGWIIVCIITFFIVYIAIRDYNIYPRLHELDITPLWTIDHYHTLQL